MNDKQRLLMNITTVLLVLTVIISAINLLMIVGVL